MDKATTVWQLPRAHLTETHAVLGTELRGAIEQLLFGDHVAGSAISVLDGRVL